MNSTRQQIREIMATVFNIREDDIPDDATPNTLEQWDSMKHMILIVALEEEFEVRFPDESVEDLVSIDSIEFKIKQLLDI